MAKSKNHTAHNQSTYSKNTELHFIVKLNYVNRLLLVKLFEEVLINKIGKVLNEGLLAMLESSLSNSAAAVVYRGNSILPPGLLNCNVWSIH